jgi:hypothetical protein
VIIPACCTVIPSAGVDIVTPGSSPVLVEIRDIVFCLWYGLLGSKEIVLEREAVILLCAFAKAVTAA